MRNFYMNAGPFGPMQTTPGQYSKPANPYVLMRMKVGSKPQAVTATLAGKRESCCSGCAHDTRNGK